MKILALGDIHGRQCWKRIVTNETFDKIIFVGDYLDSREHITPHEQLDNLREIIAYKTDNPEKCELLFGNHDFHYLVDFEQYSGYMPAIKADAAEIYHRAIKENLIKAVHIEHNILFSHAGISKTWLKSVLGVEDISVGPFQAAINDMLFYQPRIFRFTPGENLDCTGDDITQTPIWIRPDSLKSDMPSGFKQVVGHTTQYSINTTSDLILIDTLGTSKEYLVIDDGVVSTNKWTNFN